MDMKCLGQCQLFLTGDVEGQHRVGAGMPQYGRIVVSGQLQVLWLGAVAIQHSGYLAGAPGPPGRALAGLGTHRDAQLVACGFGHMSLLGGSVTSFGGHGQGRDSLSASVDNGVLPACCRPPTTLAVTPG